MEHIRFIRRPNLTMHPGIVVNENTEFEYSSERVKQNLKNLVCKSVTTVSGEGYEGTYNTVLHLQPGDVLIYDGEDRGYVKPVEQFVRISEAIEELNCIQDLG